ncbi:MAG: hypothetical protein LBD73_00665 [Deferribacteraceae bacterium]|jgi:hypothetical protein|nr:hypothetical protein [Deferribacteraceae bacterium]
MKRFLSNNIHKILIVFLSASGDNSNFYTKNAGEYLLRAEFYHPIAGSPNDNCLKLAFPSVTPNEFFSANYPEVTGFTNAGFGALTEYVGDVALWFEDQGARLRFAGHEETDISGGKRYYRDTTSGNRIEIYEYTETAGVFCHRASSVSKAFWESVGVY